jgi:hypothetical protein
LPGLGRWMFLGAGVCGSSVDAFELGVGSSVDAFELGVAALAVSGTHGIWDHMGQEASLPTLSEALVFDAERSVSGWEGMVLELGPI